MNEVSKSLNEKITAKEMRPYGELTVNTGGGKIAFISNNFKELSDLESADIARLWGDLT